MYGVTAINPQIINDGFTVKNINDSNIKTLGILNYNSVAYPAVIYKEEYNSSRIVSLNLYPPTCIKSDNGSTSETRLIL